MSAIVLRRDQAGEIAKTRSRGGRAIRTDDKGRYAFGPASIACPT